MCGVEEVTQNENPFIREEVSCVICGVKDEEFLFDTPERLVRCRRCGLIYNNPRLDAESLKKIYAKEYFVIDTDKPGIHYKAYANYIEEEPLIIRSMHRRLKKVEGLGKDKGRLLDVGCAAGFSLIAARQARLGAMPLCMSLPAWISSLVIHARCSSISQPLGGWEGTCS